VPILPVVPAAVAIQTTPNIKIGSVHDFGVGTYQDVEGHKTELLQSLTTTTQIAAEDQNWLREALLEKYQIQKGLKRRDKGTITRLRNQLKAQNGRLKAANDAHINRTSATALYEDFMFYQDPRNRKAFLKGTKAKTSKAALVLGQGIGKLRHVQRLTTDETYNCQIEPYVGGSRRSNIGVASRLQAEIRHQGLHLFTPNFS
jgi:hypothetical protein